ncbi:hypothetical protein [Salinarimonas soli]|uniref:Uncharacterized protein n=1 Tax=Salinarimonas soli TaxID=1638099 RepID=A0A5B2VQW1_9HYPH|nr:hypothetical protein [Salinarimonas soli]KAA2241058.1 hypothetical protein F0L46_05320 [Salinarimonas soli]
MNRAFGVQVTMPGDDAGAYPLVVVATGERDAELVAARAAGGEASAVTLRELTEEEARQYGLDMGRHGDAKALPALNL